MSEGVNSAAFTAVQNRSSVLLAAMGGKWLRSYDFRISDGGEAGSQHEPQSATSSATASAAAAKPASTVTQMAVYPTRAISGVTANPWDENSFASYGDGMLTLKPSCIRRAANNLATRFCGTTVGPPQAR